MFPRNATTFPVLIQNAGTATVTTTPATVLSVRMQQSGTQSETMVLCGSTEIAHNFGVRDYSIDLLSYFCSSTISVNKTGAGDSAFVTVTLIPGDIAFLPPDPYYGFAPGEVLINFFLFLVILGGIIGYFSKIIRKK